ncbi:hypothetical protein AAHA92_00633 [Salvia divinorum]|uniref:Uncharacterized protein n=1 Tax=Salvia divinorum TaxID=28513 RepID=A0ABD1IKV3_SALDI
MISWIKSKKTPFTGPISFLVAFYVDPFIATSQGDTLTDVGMNPAHGSTKSDTNLVNDTHDVEWCKKFPTITAEDKNSSTTPSFVVQDTHADNSNKVKTCNPIEINDYPKYQKSTTRVACSSIHMGGTKDEVIDVDDIVKSAIDAYIECGDGDDDDAVCVASFVNKSVSISGNAILINDMDKGKSIDVEADIKNRVDAYMEIEDNECDFVTPCSKKSYSNNKNKLVIYDTDRPKDDIGNWKLNVRSKAEMKLSTALRSPFYERALKVSNKLNPDERMIYYWLMTTHNTNEVKLLYDDDVVEVRMLEFMSLLPHTEISDGIVSAWCSVLNNKEDFRAPSSPKQLFFTTYPALYTIVKASADPRNTNFKWGDIDLIFFPFCVFKRDYTVCFCFNKKTVVIIDSSKEGDDRDLRFNYGDIPETLRTFLCRYLTKIVIVLP